MLTGSWSGIPESPSWIERYWFQPLLRGENTHINSSHLIVYRELFDSLAGFSEHLETGEDYDLSARAKAAGHRVVDNPELEVIHEGYPKDIRAFVRREIWHGKGDFVSVSAFVRSKVAVVAMGFLFLHLGIAFGAWFDWRVALSAAVLIVFTCLAASLAKYQKEPPAQILINSFLYYWYFWARALSFFSRKTG